MLICFIKGEIMFTIDIVLGVLKKVFGNLLSFLWEYKEWGNMVIENSKQIASKGDKSE